jgi:hypothetical protein
VREHLFYFSIIAYGLFSSPTPDNFGWPEAMVALSILISFAHPSSFNSLIQKPQSLSLGFHHLFFVYVATIPLFLGLLYGHNSQSIIRDYIPVLLLCIPIITPRIWNKNHLEWALIICGTSFAIRFLIDFISFNAHGMLYLANSPLVPFTTLIGFHWITMTQPTTSQWFKRFIGLVIFIIGVMAMILMAQRAPLVLSLLGVSIIIGFRIIQSPIRTTLINLILGIIGISLIPLFWVEILSISNKFLTIGDNNRLADIQAVLYQVTIWGHGWGYEWQSPAVADYWVRYTHNMTTYYWLKTGFIGAILSIGFIYIWGLESLKACKHNIAIGLAIFVPLTIHFFLYTGYKTFDLSLLLTFLVLCNHHLRDHRQS